MAPKWHHARGDMQGRVSGLPRYITVFPQVRRHMGCIGTHANVAV